MQILSVGRAVEKKGYDVLLRGAWRCCRATCLALRPYRRRRALAALKALADALGIADRDDWPARSPSRRCWSTTAEADIFALACRVAADGDRDGLPNVLVEAASQRLACVSTTVSGVPELLCDGENGLVVPPDDPAGARRRRWSALIRDPALRQRLGAAAEARVREHFDHRASIGQLTALFEREWQVAAMSAPRCSSMSSICSASAIWRAPAASPRRCGGDGSTLTMVTGGRRSPAFPPPALRQVALPPLTAGDQGFSGLVDLDGKPIDDAYRDRRRDARCSAAFADRQTGYRDHRGVSVRPPADAFRAAAAARGRSRR